MKKILVLFICLCVNSITNAQNNSQNVNSKVASATVFLNSAQVNREKIVSLKKGENILKFVNLSPFVDSKSIQVKAKNIEIQAINFKKDYLRPIKKNSKLQEQERELKGIENRINNKDVDLEIIQEELNFLRANKDIGGNQTLTANTFKEAANYYGSKIKELKKSEFALKKELKLLKEKTTELKKQINEAALGENFGSGEITIRLNSEVAKSNKFIVTYNVSNVRWYPTYDVRVANISSPIELVYKANLYQNSKVDWSNVKLNFSSGNPTKSNKVQEVKPYFLDYGTLPPNYSKSINSISGIVNSDDGPLPGVNVIIKGTTIGTTTDFDGKYSLEMPSGKNTLTFSYLGYEPKDMAVRSNVVDVYLEESSNSLDEVVVVGYGTTRRNKKKKENKKISTYEKPQAVSLINTKQIINQTTVNFAVVKPYTIKSSNTNFSIPMKAFNLPSNYQYFSFPRADLGAYLVAKVKNWEDYNLLEAEANIYFEDTFIGTTLIDPRMAKEELEISLGIDKNVIVTRTKEKDFTTKQFLGSKKEESRIWSFSVKNNKREAIDIVILDQIPISKSETIKIELDKEITNGNLDKKTGEIKWNFNLPSKKIESFKLKYKVKYSKNDSVILD
jgi:hypothetical protein